MKITILDGYGMNPGDMSWEPLEQLGELTVYDRTAPSEILGRAAGSEALLTNKTVLTGEILRALPGLRYVGVLATGYNVVDIDTARQLGIVVTNIPAYSTDSVVQMVFAHLLAITNRVEHYTAENRRGRWSGNPDFCYWDSPLRELSGKTFGIVGLGNIGMAVSRVALAFGMKVKAYTSKSPDKLPEGVAKADLDELFSTSDVVSLHCPLTESTRHLVNAARLAQMKPSAILINTGRGPLVDEEALAEALGSGRIHAAGLDVLTSEPPSADNQLLKAPNCFITPHLGWATKEARERLLDIATNNLRGFIAGDIRNNVAR
ncbi:MAG: D-2-hydroxyacid dehydrogenase [Duncaniella sp.]|uniref:D-2-hydroxyacid dehydrogenase n=1 Tax=Duncaniella sp. TaxID=2518496 RepID=UPI0023D0C7A3|nr:D-2-hydroxyacid dehydrogenase [Duncaniella sp.]MDE5989834.1 D-2-hydroxyacid dehydrogenase [Duncaniella sp.]